MGRFIFHFEYGWIPDFSLLKKTSLLSEIKSDFVHSIEKFDILDRSNEIYEILKNQLRNKWKDCKLIDIFFLHYSRDMNSLKFVLVETETEETNFNRNYKQYDLDFSKIIEDMKFFNIKRKFLFQIPINNEILSKLLWENKVNVEMLNPFALNISHSQHVDILELLKSSIKESFKNLPSFLSALIKKNENQIMPYYSTNHTVIKTKFTSNFDENLKILYRHSIRQYIFNFYYQFFNFSLHNFDGWLEKIFEIYTDYDISSLKIMKEYLENIAIKWIKQPTIWLKKLDKMVWSNHERTNTGKIKFDDETEQEMFFFNLLDFESYYTPIFEKIYLIEDKVKNSIQNIKQKIIVSPKEVKEETHIRPEIVLLTVLQKELTSLKKIFKAELNEIEGFPVWIPPEFKGKLIIYNTNKPGTNSAASAVAELKRTFSSIKHFIFCGIAGGMPQEVNYGDIIISDESGVTQYDYGKEYPDRFEPRGNSFPSDFHLLEFAKNYINHFKENELENLHSFILETSKSLKIEINYSEHFPINILIGKIGSANRVLANPVARDKLYEDHKIIAVEMEGAGVATAAYRNGVSYLLIRGISDYCDSEKNDDYHILATLTVSFFTYNYLRFYAEDLFKLKLISPTSKKPNIHTITQNTNQRDIPRFTLNPKIKYPFYQKPKEGLVLLNLTDSFSPYILFSPSFKSNEIYLGAEVFTEEIDSHTLTFYELSLEPQLRYINPLYMGSAKLFILVIDENNSRSMMKSYKALNIIKYFNPGAPKLAFLVGNPRERKVDNEGYKDILRKWEVTIVEMDLMKQENKVQFFKVIFDTLKI